MSKNENIENDSLWKACQQAVNMTIAEGTVCTGFSIQRVMNNLNTITSAGEWSKEYLFQRVAKMFIAIYANQCGKRAGIKGKGVYFDEDTLNKSVAEGLLLNEIELSKSYAGKVSDLSIKVKKKGQDRQLAFDDPSEPTNVFEERSLEWLTDYIREMDGGD